MFDHPIPRVFQNRFSTQYRCFSVSMLAGPNDRFLPRVASPSFLYPCPPESAYCQHSAGRLNITYPMLFKLTNKNSDRMTHCGVLEFVADEGICYLPHWMMQNLLLEEGGLVQVESVNLQVATYSKFQPQSPDFLDITNPKAVLENALRNFACLTTGDVIAINYNEKVSGSASQLVAGQQMCRSEVWMPLVSVHDESCMDAGPNDSAMKTLLVLVAVPLAYDSLGCCDLQLENTAVERGDHVPGGHGHGSGQQGPWRELDGEVVACPHSDMPSLLVIAIYELRVMETKPDKAVSIIECDMNVDFDAPLGYKEPERQVQHEESAEGDADPSGYAGELGFRVSARVVVPHTFMVTKALSVHFIRVLPTPCGLCPKETAVVPCPQGSPHTPPLVQAFSGSGNRLDGKKKGVEPSPSPIKPGDIKRLPALVPARWRQAGDISPVDHVRAEAECWLWVGTSLLGNEGLRSWGAGGERMGYQGSTWALLALDLVGELSRGLGNMRCRSGSQGNSLEGHLSQSPCHVRAAGCQHPTPR
ncbi:ubiquitin fusion degradation protein 1-like protein [Camelus ferus]|nr:ubiquitin fusion degradation protein 1-like protein [Camelus ferus]